MIRLYGSFCRSKLQQATHAGSSMRSAIHTVSTAGGTCSRSGCFELHAAPPIQPADRLNLRHSRHCLCSPMADAASNGMSTWRRQAKGRALAWYVCCGFQTRSQLDFARVACAIILTHMLFFKRAFFRLLHVTRHYGFGYVCSWIQCFPKSGVSP